MSENKKGTPAKPSSKKNFLNKATRKQILNLHQQGMSPSQIAQQLSIKTRQVKDHLDILLGNKKNSFSQSDDYIIRQFYLQGITKEWTIARFLPGKAPWMVRNRINYLKKYGLMNIQMNLQMIPQVPLNVTEIAPINSTENDTEEIFNIWENETDDM